MRITNTFGEKISEDMFGLFFEDINCAADGGLYAEMIENRSFEAKESHGTPGNFYAIDDFGYAWHAVCKDGEEAPRMQYVTGTPLSVENPHYLRFTSYASGQGFSNQAYDGIYMEKGETFKVSFYARCVKYQGESFSVEIQKDGIVYASDQVAAVHPIPYLPFSDLKMEIHPEFEDFAERIAAIKALDSTNRSREHQWNYYEMHITARETVRGADFILRLGGTGIVEFDLISMIPESAVAGVFRKDLFEALKEMNPGFIRFPGGCIVEGISLENRYQWKKTVGELKDRKYIPNLWSFEDDRMKTEPDIMRPTTSHYGQSYGIGFYEYFLLCELLGAKALPVLGMGVACQFRTTEMVDSDSPEFDAFIQDALDLIEFANGPADSRWGSLRARMGHPRPFGLEMLAVGNEQWETQYVDLYQRHKKFEEAIHAVYPDMKLLGTAGPILDLPLFDEAWDFYRKGEADKPGFCYGVDEHYYVPPKWLYEHVDFYDEYPRDVAVFAGEYAAHTKERENTMESALAEAAFLTGVERNADVVKLASYAPLFNRIGHSQWKPDLIWFDDQKVYTTPSYQVQKMYANYRGDYIVPLNGQEKELRAKGIYVSVTRNEDEFFVKAVNTTEEDFLLEFEDDKGNGITGEAKAYILESAGTKEPDLPEPSRIREVTTMLHGEYVLEKNKFTILSVRVKP
ncbi:MAG: alpha-L-arabinofuranosidase [Blautia sp.]|nr:alpha-L-arabinofuranosidase [Blautia sp.]